METRKKLEGNGLWESSRMMLPEHKEALIKNRIEENRKIRPVLDDQELELIMLAIQESLQQHKNITLRLFDAFDDVYLTGIVTLIHTYRQEIKLVTGPGEWNWIKIEDVISASI